MHALGLSHAIMPYQNFISHCWYHDVIKIIARLLQLTMLINVCITAKSMIFSHRYYTIMEAYNRL